MKALQRWVSWAMPATPEERAAALWSFAYFFTLLAGYYVLRPLRDQMGIAGGVKTLPWLFTATFAVLIVAQPVYGALVAKLPRARFIPIVYHFFVANLALFWLALTVGVAPVIVARVFFVWVSVFNLFAVAVFWSFMADLFTAEQGKRLFGFIGAGGTAGGLLGPLITIGLSVPFGAVNLLIAAAVLLELAVFCVHRLERAATAQAVARGLVDTGPQRVGGSAFAALPEVLRSPYLIGVGAWVSLLSFCATIVYFEQANIVSAAVPDRDAAGGPDRSRVTHRCHRWVPHPSVRAMVREKRTGAAAASWPGPRCCSCSDDARRSGDSARNRPACPEISWNAQRRPRRDGAATSTG